MYNVRIMRVRPRPRPAPHAPYSASPGGWSRQACPARCPRSPPLLRPCPPAPSPGLSAHTPARLERPLRQAPQSDKTDREGWLLGRPFVRPRGRTGNPPPALQTHTQSPPLPTHPSGGKKHVHDCPQYKRPKLMAQEGQRLKKFRARRALFLVVIRWVKPREAAWGRCHVKLYKTLVLGPFLLLSSEYFATHTPSPVPTPPLPSISLLQELNLATDFGKWDK